LRRLKVLAVNLGEDAGAAGAVKSGRSVRGERHPGAPLGRRGGRFEAGVVPPPTCGAIAPTDIDRGVVERFYQARHPARLRGVREGPPEEGPFRHGDRLGKTRTPIALADLLMRANSSSSAAPRFDANYPHLAGHFARVIDVQVPCAQSLIDDFSDPISLSRPRTAL
jgi:hypothetical protein